MEGHDVIQKIEQVVQARNWVSHTRALAPLQTILKQNNPAVEIVLGTATLRAIFSIKDAEPFKNRGNFEGCIRMYIQLNSYYTNFRGNRQIDCAAFANSEYFQGIISSFKELNKLIT
jgi:hypothetical protein